MAVSKADCWVENLDVLRVYLLVVLKACSMAGMMDDLKVETKDCLKAAY